jgi:chromosome segregation ATPase
MADKGANVLDNERARLMRKYETIRSEVQTYENNLGFLNASSKKGNSLIDEMNRKVEKLRNEMNLVREKIRAIDKENDS